MGGGSGRLFSFSSEGAWEDDISGSFSHFSFSALILCSVVCGTTLAVLVSCFIRRLLDRDNFEIVLGDARASIAIRSGYVGVEIDFWRGLRV